MTCITILDGTKRIEGLKNIGDGCPGLKSVIVPAAFFEDVDIEKRGIDVHSFISVKRTEISWSFHDWHIDGPQLFLWSAPNYFDINPTFHVRPLF